MEKVTLACLSSERQRAIKQLQALGTFHVVPMTPPTSEELDALRRLREQTVKVQALLKSTLSSAKATPAPMKSFSFTETEKLVTSIFNDMEKARQAEEELHQVRKNQSLLEPWGSFSRESFKTLEKHGIHAVLCASSASNMQKLPKGAVIRTIAEKDGQKYYAVFSTSPLDDENLPRIQLPDNTSIAFWKEREATLLDSAAKWNDDLQVIAKEHLAEIEKFEAVLDEHIDFAKARDGMGKSKNISFIRGYIPLSQIDSLRAVARQSGWAIRYEEVPADDTEAPTKLEIPKPFRMAQAIFDFVGILPGYHETDVSVCLLIFLSLFCGILVGDAGYGTLFTLVVLWLRTKVKDPKKRLGVNLLLTMSVTILVYGALTCNWFAIPADKLPSWMNICPWMCNNEKHIQLLSFFIGAFHMCLAHAWCALKAARTIKLSEDNTIAFLKKVREALGHIGWGLFLWANFGMIRLLVIKGGNVTDLETPFVWLYIFGFIFILAFSINWTDMGAVIYSPFGFINSFVDVLSYIRLFAVGLSGLYIAQSFNDMAMGLHSLNMPALTIPAAVLILALGHLLNIVMAFMSVLVHGIRLNTLEFSGHIGLNWLGKAYSPLHSQEKGGQ